MISNIFNNILEDRINKIRDTLSTKAKEYAFMDRLHNFKVAAQITGQSPPKALWGMLIKHLVSVIDLVEGRQELTTYMIDEKIGDLINYLILLEALFREELENEL